MAGAAPPHEDSVTDTACGVLDASAVLAFMYDEPGADRVEATVARGAVVSIVNWAEAISRMIERGETVDAAAQRVVAQMSAVGTLVIAAFDERMAREAARLRLPTRHLGLSLADRACLALGRLRRLSVLTTDRSWRSLHISVRIEVIR